MTRIRKPTKPDQWHHVSTDQNPADHGTRLIPAAHLQHTSWLSSPEFLRQADSEVYKEVESFVLVEPSWDEDIRPQVTTLVTKATEQSLGSYRFERFSSWKSLVRGMATLTHIARSSSQASWTEKCTDWHCCNNLHQSPLKKLDPFIDDEGLMRVGGRLRSADMSDLEKHPLIIPASHHVAT